MTRGLVTCSLCQKRFAVHAFIAPSEDYLYLYCEKDHTVMLVRHSDLRQRFGISRPANRDIPEIIAKIKSSVEPRIVRCKCGGRFSFGIGFRCPKCNGVIAGGYFENHWYYLVIGKTRIMKDDAVWKKE